VDRLTAYSVCCLFVLEASVTLSVAEVPYRRMVGCAVDDEWEGMWKERVVDKFVSLSTFPETSDRNHSRCRGSSLRNCCLKSRDKITPSKCNTVQMVTVYCVTSHVADRQINPLAVIMYCLVRPVAR
jgi:hypothetical protein